MKVLVLAGGFDQIELIKEIKSKGCDVILADYYESPPAKAYADKHFQISTLDEEKIYELAKEEKVDLITTACTDQALLTMARVSVKLGLPSYLSEEVALKMTNKFYMKQCFKDNGIPTADFVLIDDRGKIENSVCEIKKFPQIVKPCDCNSSKGVTKVTGMERLIEAANTAFELSRSGKVIIEEYIEGVELSIDVWIERDAVKILDISETCKINENNDFFTIFRSIYPVDHIENVEEKIKKVAGQIAEAFSLSDCPMLIQALIYQGDIYVIEASARMGGGTKYKYIKEISGIDIMKIYVNRIMGDTDQVLNPIKSTKFFELDYVYAYNGTVTQIIGLEELKEKGVLDDYFVYKPVGSVVSKRTTSSDRILGFLISDLSRAELVRKREFVVSNIDIRDKDKSIIYRDCFRGQ